MNYNKTVQSIIVDDEISFHSHIKTVDLRLIANTKLREVFQARGQTIEGQKRSATVNVRSLFIPALIVV